MMLNNKRYGWRPQLPDIRDLKLPPTELGANDLPPYVDLRPLSESPYNQGDENSCVGNGCAYAANYMLRREKKVVIQPSRNFIYWNARTYDNSTAVDQGAQVRDGIKGIAQYGVCDEDIWQYSDSTVLQEPSAEAYASARTDLALKYLAPMQSELELCARIASGYPVIFGFTAYDLFESAQVANTGILQMPQPNESVVGGHCVVLVGYNATDRHFIVRNSWGTQWGMQGHFVMPFDYVLSPDLASDFWTLEMM